MKGVILAGGLGTRLRPLTKITNKHLLPIYDKPMIYYPIEAMVNAGIEDILIVCGGNHAGEFLRLLGNGKDFGLTSPELHLPRRRRWNRRCPFAHSLFRRRQEKVAVMLGDNIIEKNFKQAGG